MAYAVQGLYPFVVNGAITVREVLGTIEPGALAAGLVAHLAFCGVLLWGFLKLLGHIARYGVVPVARRRGRA